MPRMTVQHGGHLHTLHWLPAAFFQLNARHRLHAVAMVPGKALHGLGPGQLKVCLTLQMWYTGIAMPKTWKPLGNQEPRWKPYLDPASLFHLFLLCTLVSVFFLVAWLLFIAKLFLRGEIES